MIELHNLPRPAGSRKNRKRIGRGPGSGTGKTSGRGEKGQNSRSGGGVPAWFEGGQMPLQRRVPKRGFTNRNRVEYQVVNVCDLAVAGSVATPETMKTAGLIRTLKKPVKLLGHGEVKKAVRCSVHAASASARSKVEAAGGSVTILSRGGEAATTEKASTGKASKAKASDAQIAEEATNKPGAGAATAADASTSDTTDDTSAATPAASAAATDPEDAATSAVANPSADQDPEKAG